jgi:hypothetical protein
MDDFELKCSKEKKRFSGYPNRAALEEHYRFLRQY